MPRANTCPECRWYASCILDGLGDIDHAKTCTQSDLRDPLTTKQIDREEKVMSSAKTCLEYQWYKTCIGGKTCTLWPVASNKNLNARIEGNKNDSGKLRYSLLYWPFVTGIVRVLMFGAKKYGDFDWQKVPNLVERYTDAAIRHLKDNSGDDKESGEDSLLHAACCLMFLYWFKQGNKK